VQLLGVLKLASLAVEFRSLVQLFLQPVEGLLRGPSGQLSLAGLCCASRGFSKTKLALQIVEGLLGWSFGQFELFVV
jgi:hypothetical protein